uniref:Uncharacterized protein n=1 Tax=Cucumis sativus TaxID=3659 RepID=A0A0A0LCB2_CUCSA
MVVYIYIIGLRGMWKRTRSHSIWDHATRLGPCHVGVKSIKFALVPCVEYLCSNSSQTNTLSSSNTSDIIQKRELYYFMRCKLQIRRVKHMGRVKWSFEILLLARRLWSCLRLKYWFEGNSRIFKEIVKDHIGGSKENLMNPNCCGIKTQSTVAEIKFQIRFYGNISRASSILIIDKLRVSHDPHLQQQFPPHKIHMKGLKALHSLSVLSLILFKRTMELLFFFFVS